MANPPQQTLLPFFIYSISHKDKLFDLLMIDLLSLFFIN